MALIIFFFLLISPGTAISFNFSSFGPSTQDIKLDGNATFLDSAIQLTADVHFLTGRATYYLPIQLSDESSGNASFITNFTYSIDNRNNASYADGFAFFLVNTNFILPAQQGSGLGLASGNQTLNSTSNPFVAAEFDTNHNEFDSDSGPHVGLDVNSLKSIKTRTWDSSLDGRTMDASIVYNSTTHSFCVYFEEMAENIPFTENVCDTIDLREHLSDSVNIGFSATTGTYAEFHSIKSWSFHSYSPLSPPPSGLLILDSANDEYRALMIAGWSVAGVLLLVLMVGGMILFHRKAIENGSSRVEVESVIQQNQFGNSAGIQNYIVVTDNHPSNVQNVRNIEIGPTIIGGNVVEAAADSIIVKSQEDEFRRVSGARNIPFDDLVRATDGFSEERKLGQGGFGAVYRGYLRELGVYGAVKRISTSSVQGIAEYTAEVMILSQLRHMNLVQLIGWCHENKEFLVVYEYLPNRSLDCHLYCDKCILKWELRNKIIKGLAEGLHYLHRGWRRCILHRDIKPSNVMLDSEFNPMLGDFGLARIVDHDARSQTLHGGSHGYIAPECLETGKSSKESDIFSFGVVALELASGRKPFVQKKDGTQIHIVKWVWEFYGIGKILEAADQKLNGDFAEKEMECLMIIGLWCAHPEFLCRPSMREVISVLSFEAPVPDLPTKFPGTAHSLPLPGSVTWSSGNATFRATATNNSIYNPMFDTSNSTASPTVPLVRQAH